MISTRKFGIEFEHVSNLDWGHLAQALATAKVPIDPDGIRRTNPAYNGWSVKADGSITACAKYPYQIELVTPPVTLHNTKEIRTALKVAREHGGVNSSCGMHVHVHAPELVEPLVVSRNREVMEYVSKSWLAVEPIFRTYCPPSRRASGMCRPGVEWQNKYKAINFSPLASHKKTVEFRLHSATLNSTKALSFASLCVAFVDALIARMHFQKLSPAYVAKHVKQHWLTTHTGNTVNILRDEGIWHIKSKSLQVKAPTLRDAWHWKDELSIKANHYLPGFHYPWHGNAMSKLCASVGVKGVFRGYLEDRYELLLQKHGVIGDNGARSSLVLADEADFFHERDIQETDPEPLQAQEWGPGSMVTVMRESSTGLDHLDETVQEVVHRETRMQPATDANVLQWNDLVTIDEELRRRA